MSPFQPIVDMAWNRPPVHTVCPAAGSAAIGCTTSQRQQEAEYTELLRAQCTMKRVQHSSIGNHDYNGGGGESADSKLKYDASYIEIPGKADTVDPKSGGIRHTIIIVRNTSTLLGGAPMLRVTPVTISTGIPLGGLFEPAWKIEWPSAGDATLWQAQQVFCVACVQSKRD